MDNRTKAFLFNFSGINTQTCMKLIVMKVLKKNPHKQTPIGLMLRMRTHHVQSCYKTKQTYVIKQHMEHRLQ